MLNEQMIMGIHQLKKYQSALSNNNLILNETN